MVVNCWQPGEELAYWEDNYTDSTLPAGSQTLQRGVNEDRVGQGRTERMREARVASGGETECYMKEGWIEWEGDCGEERALNVIESDSVYGMW
jgi:hypothetical protein